MLTCMSADDAQLLNSNKIWIAKLGEQLINPMLLQLMMRVQRRAYTISMMGKVAHPCT